MSRKWADMFEVRHPFFKPFWRRFVATALCLGWAVFEWSNDAQLWALLFTVAGGYLFWQFFVRFKPEDYDSRN